ncbi:hypothetical protein HAX54_035813 [Datura stramonium]|uniref:SHSP domain-containing protein n=1 Tax=Datura stramonium TaxID=4076 RepID=A0ABS8RM79_DATST|nr:hypothetical protein [Datura stramonium]
MPDDGEVKEVHQSEKMIYEVNQDGSDMMVDKQKDPQIKTNLATVITDGDDRTCTTVSWTFRIFYEKALLEYERHKTQSGELQLPIPPPPDSLGVDNEVNLCLIVAPRVPADGNKLLLSKTSVPQSEPQMKEVVANFSIRKGTKRDSATRAMQGWHEQAPSWLCGGVGEPIVKGKDANNMRSEKNLKHIVEHSVKATRTETSKQLITTVVDVGPPTDWVKINVRETKDCFEVYALVPGLLREEVRVQSDPAGRLVITGQPDQLDNPWGITAFKKVVSLPARIDPLHTSAVVSLHGRLFVRVPFAQ